MRIGINLTEYYRGSVGGIRSYLITLAKDLPAISSKDVYYVICRPEGEKDFKFPGVKIVIVPNDIQGKDLSDKLLKIIDQYKLDFWYSTLLRLDPINCPIPCAFMIPDMQHETYPQFFTSEVLNWRKNNMAQSAISADKILTISNFSKNEIVKYLKVDPSKVEVTYLSTPYWHDNPYKEKDNLSTLRKYKLTPKKYLFFTANTWPHKNLKRLIEAFILIKDEFPEIEVVLVVQSEKVDPLLKSLIANNNLEKRVRFLGFIDDNIIQYIFKNSLAIVCPSLFEGFGIPALEAMKHGVPFTCSNTTSLPEICGDAALYFDPLSVLDISKSLKRIIVDENLRANLIKKGFAQVKKFTSKATALKTIKIIKGTVSEFHKVVKISKYPKISIVTPSYNQGEFIERTIKSVLDQKYPNLEYIVMDGGSTDNTLDILKKYDKQIIWRSEKDRGQTHAINKGLSMATGEILAYLNSDDTYEQNALFDVAKYFIQNIKTEIVFGLGKQIDSKDQYLQDCLNAPVTFETLFLGCEISQPSVFWRKSLASKVGQFDEKFDYAMDYEYWIRISKKYQFGYIKKYLSSTRIHGQTKTNTQFEKVHQNIFDIQVKHYGKVSDQWIQSYSNHLLNNYDHRIWSQRVKYYIALFLELNKLQQKYNHHQISGPQLINILSQLKSLLLNNPLKQKIKNLSKKYINNIYVFVRKVYYILSRDGIFYKNCEIGILNQHPPKNLVIEKFPKPISKKFLKFTIVTPSYNQGEFIGKTISSVLNQKYPNLQYSIQDGASTDTTLGVLKKYKNKIKYVSAKDSGQTDAINKGFYETDGEIMAYLNSDDMYSIGTLMFVNDYFQSHPEVDVIYGNRLIVDENNKQIGRWVLPPCNTDVLKFLDYIPQETMFWRRSIWDKIGGELDESFRFAMDWDLILKFINAGANIKHVPYFLGIFRHHSQQKTATQINSIGQQECDRLMIQLHTRPITHQEFVQLLDKYRRKAAMFSFLYDFGIKI